MNVPVRKLSSLLSPGFVCGLPAGYDDVRPTTQLAASLNGAEKTTVLVVGVAGGGVTTGGVGVVGGLRRSHENLLNVAPW